MRELLLLDLAGFRCGVRKEDILSHEEQTIHWLTENNRAVIAIAMMGAHPVSLADLSYCLGLASTRRAGKYPVLVPADHDLSVSFVAEQALGRVQVSCSAVYPLPAYLQTPFIDSCVQLDGKLVPLINIQAVHCRISAGDYTPPTPQCCLPGLTEEKKEREERTPSPDALRIFTCKKKSFAASAAYFSSEQALPPGVLTRLPLMPECVRGITLHNNQVLTVLDIRRYLQRSSAPADEEEKWLIGEVEGQGFAFVVATDQGLLPAEAASLAALPWLVRSDWQQSAVLHARKIIPVLDFSELLAKHPDEIRSRSRTVPRDVQSDGRFKAVFGQQQVEIVEFSLCTMVHALPDLEVADCIPFSHCQRLTGTKGLVVGVTLYRKELLPVLDPARCFGRESRPVAGWKLVLVCNGDVRVLVLAEEVLGKRTLSVGEQRALPFTTQHSSVYGCYPVDGRVGLIFNILALAVFFDEERIRELFLFADDLLPPVNDAAEKDLEEQENEQKNEQENEVFPEVFLPASSASPESDKENFPADQYPGQSVSVRLAGEQDSLVQSVVSAMLSRKKDEATYAAEKEIQKNQDDKAVEDSLECTEEPERFEEIREESDNVFLSVVAAMLSRKETGSKSDIEAVSKDAEKSAEEGTEVASISLAASPVLLTDDQDHLITSALASMMPGGEKEEEEKEKGGSEIYEGREEQQEVDTVSDTSQRVAEPHAEAQEVLGLSSVPDDPLQHAEEHQQADQSTAVSSADDEEDASAGFADFEEPNVTASEPDPEPVLLAQEQEKQDTSAPSDASKFSESSESPDSLEDFKETGGDTDQTEHEGQHASHALNILEDADAFPELREFIRQVAEAQQADSPLALPHTDSVKNVTFPRLFSPDPRKIKARRDKIRQNEQELLFQETVGEQEEVSELRYVQPKDEGQKRTKLWVFLLLLILLSGFLLWFFVFGNQREKSMQPETRLAKINRATFPQMKDAIKEEAVKDAVPEQREMSEAAEKGDRESTSAPPVVSAPVVLQSNPESESTLEGREETEQAILAEEVPVEEIPAEEIIKGPIDQPAQAIPEQISANTLIEDIEDIEDLPKKIEPDPASVSGNHEKQQEKKPEFQEQNQAQSEEGDDEKSDALPQDYAVDDGAGGTEHDNIIYNINKGINNGIVDDIVDDITPESAMTAEKDSAEGVTGAPFDDAENENKHVVTEGATEQKVTAEAEETQAHGLSTETASDSTPILSGALTETDRTETDRADDEQKKTAGVERINIALNNERTTPAEQQKTPLIPNVNGTSDHARHTVSKGETLWEISEQYTGSGFNYPDVAKKNKIINPDLIYPDQQVTLPVKK